MASIIQAPCRAVSASLGQPQFNPRSSTVTFNSIPSTPKSIQKSSISGTVLTSERPLFRFRAAADDDSVPAKEEPSVAVQEVPKEPTAMDKLKKSLVDSFYGTERGLTATRETKAEIVELVTKLESKNPTPAPAEALPLLNGKWVLAFTSFAGLFPLLSSGLLPLVEVEEISQTIDSHNLTVQNSVRFSGPLATASISTNAKFEVQSAKGMQIKFEEGVIGTPQLTESLVFPEDVEVLGQKIDLGPLKGILTSVQDTASSVAKTISDQPDLKFPISNDEAQSWLITTYLDQELRISRGDDGSIFVLIKEGSYLLKL